MGKRKHRRRPDRELAVVAAPTPAERHTFSAGLLGHDLTASTWLINVSEQTALGNDAVYDCVRIIADAVAGAQVGEWRGTEALAASRLTRRPMATVTRREWLWQVAATLALYNLVYIQEVGGRSPTDGLPMSLRPLAPPQVSGAGGVIRVNGEEIPPGTLRAWRRAVWPTVPADVGSLLTLARETFAAAMAADAYRSDFWQQGGAPVVVLSSDQEIDDTTAEAMRDRWVAMRTTSPGKPAVLSKGATAKGLGADLGTEGANVAGDKIRAAVARYFGMPPDMINAPSEAGPLTYSTTEGHGLHLVRYTLSAYTDTVADGLSDILPGDYIDGRVVRLSLRHLEQPTMLERYQAWATALDAPGHPGWVTAAEIRELEGFPPDLALPSAGAPAPAAEVIA